MSVRRRTVWIALAVAIAALATPAAAPTALAAAGSGGHTESVSLILAPTDLPGLQSLAVRHHLPTRIRQHDLATFGPSAGERAEVAAQLAGLGLTVTARHPWTVTARGPASRILALFGSARSVDPHSKVTHGLPFIPAEFDGEVLAALGGNDNRPIVQPLGVTRLVKPGARLSGSTVSGCTYLANGPQTQPPGYPNWDGYIGANLLSAYQGTVPPAGPTAAKRVTVATLQFSGWDDNALACYADALEQQKLEPAVSGDPLTDGQYTAVSVDGQKPNYLDGMGGDIEVALDQEVLLSVAPYANQRVYFVPNNANSDGAMFDAMADIAASASADHIVALSSSWGNCEANSTLDPTYATDERFYQAFQDVSEYVLAAGVTMFAPTGDDGIADCYSQYSGVAASAHPMVDWPASSPQWIAVGGTTLPFDANGFPESASKQTVWNDLYSSSTAALDDTGYTCPDGLPGAIPPSGSGGGISHVFAEPAWQQQLERGLSGRTLPDVASDADLCTPFAVYGDSNPAAGPGPALPPSKSGEVLGWNQVGGTSVATPTQAALLANQLEAAGVTTGLGDLHPALYGLASAKSPPFTQLASGNNGGYYTVFDAAGNETGQALVAPTWPDASPTHPFDLVSGLGSPIWSELLPAILEDPQVLLARGQHFYTNSHTVHISVTSPTAYPHWYTGAVMPGACTGSGTGWSSTMPTSFTLPVGTPQGARSQFFVVASDGTTCFPAYGIHSVFLDTVAPRMPMRVGQGSVSNQVAVGWSFHDPAPSSGYRSAKITVRDLNTRTTRPTVVVRSYGYRFGGTAGHTYLVTGRVYDAAGNASASAELRYTLPLLDTQFHHSAGWTFVADTHAVAKSDLTSTRRGATASIAAFGRYYLLWVRTGPAGGILDVAVNGHRVDRTSLYSARTRYGVRVLVYAARTDASRTITVTVEGDHIAAATGDAVYLEAIQPEL
jgi:hypothetical protein